MKSIITVLKIPTVKLWKIKVRLIKLRITMCPAVIATNNRINREKGFVNIPIISTPGIIGKGNLSHQGTPGVLNMCRQ